MENNESYEVSRGAAVTIDVALKDADGVAISDDGTSALATTVWPGGDRAASFSAATTWTSAPDGTIAIAIAASDTAALAPGRYQLLTRLTPAGGDPEDAYGCTLDVLAFASTATAPRVYTTYDDMLRYGRSWLRTLATDDDEAGFAEQQGRARSWIEDLAHAHYRVASMVMVVGQQAMGPRISGARSVWLQEQLDADTLMVTDQVRECAAKKALAYACEGQVGLGETAGQYARLARMYHSQADYLATCLTLSLDTDGDGFPDVTIDCSSTNPMYG
jgi:hypothetical protein